MGESAREVSRMMALAAAAVLIAIAGIVVAVALGALALANLLARGSEHRYHLLLRVNPDPAPTSEEAAELAAVPYEDRQILLDWLRAFRRGLGS